LTGKSKAAATLGHVKLATMKKGNHEVEHEEVRPLLTVEQLRRVKTGLTKKDLEQFARLLLEKRAEIVGDVMSMELDARGNGGNLSNMPLHMADVGSDYYEQEFTLGLVESERKLLREIDEALERIQNRTYGVCAESGKPINKARLEIKPWAKYTIEVARERERRGQAG
jgi:RNA polymerase-binding protein DksA